MKDITKPDESNARVTFDLKKQVHRRIKMLAVSEGITMQSWMRETLIRELIKHENNANHKENYLK